MVLSKTMATHCIVKKNDHRPPLLCGANKSPFVFVGWFKFLDIQVSFFVSTENKNITVCNVHTMCHRRGGGGVSASIKVHGEVKSASKR